MAQAILRQMWCECRRQWDEVSRPAPAPAVSTPGAGSTTGAPLAPLPSDRPPKDFPHWSRLVAAYNGVLVGGEKREFPTIELLGAEEVLSRIHWEHTKSKLYTPLGIGEILAKRTFSALGVVNTLAVKRNSGAPCRQLRLIDGNIAVAEDRPFTPKGVWAVVDGITPGPSSASALRRPSMTTSSGGSPRPGCTRRASTRLPTILGSGLPTAGLPDAARAHLRRRVRGHHRGPPGIQ